MDAYTFAIDLKITPDNDIRILEIMASNHAGFAGYKIATGKDMLEDTIFPDLEKTGLPFLAVGEPTNYRRIFDDLKRSGNREGLLYLPQGSDPHYRKDAASSPYTYINSDLNVLVLDRNKAAFHLHMEGAKDDMPIPPTFVGESAYHEGLADDIRRKVGFCDRYILKAPDTANGTGLRVIDDTALDRALKELFPPAGSNSMAQYRTAEGIDSSSDYWRQSPSPVFVIQPCITGKYLEKDGRFYDGTMRITLTAYRRKPDHDFTVLMHDMYWKLPLEPVGKNRTDSSIVSYSYGNRERRDQGFLTGLFNKLTKKNLYKPIDSYLKVGDDDRALVLTEMKKAMPGFIARLSDFDVRARTKEWLHSEDPMRQAMGTMLVLDRQYAPFEFDSDLVGEKGRVCEEKTILDELLGRLKKPAQNSADFYMARLVNEAFLRSNCHMLSLPFDQICLHELERIKKIQAENPTITLQNMHNP